jgi:hypothetical protein
MQVSINYALKSIKIQERDFGSLLKLAWVPISVSNTFGEQCAHLYLGEQCAHLYFSCFGLLLTPLADKLLLWYKYMAIIL